MTMNLLRSIATSILILTVLPWGAYSGAYASHSQFQQSPVATLSNSDLLLVIVSNEAEQNATFVSAVPKRCRTAVLIGSACGPDIAPPGPAISLDPFVASNSVPHASETRLVGKAPIGTRDPPRFC
jgi:hypothetical protein